MNNIQIYDINVTKDELAKAIEKLNEVHANIIRYDYNIDKEKFDTNEKISRLIHFYGDKVLPITMVNGEIVQIEKSLTINQLVTELDITPNRLQKSGLVLKTDNKCGGCGGCQSKKDSNNCSGCTTGCNRCKQ